YDPCAPIRWDELFEMDPNSKGPLWLSNRSLGQIPHDFFDGLKNLRELYLDHNDIKIVPDSLLKLSKLDTLDLSCNSISSFHSAFKMKKLKNLRRLNLDQNMLTDVSPIYKLKALRELRLNHNFVGHLAIAIQNMAKLKILTMESNSLATLPETMGKLGNLCELRLSDNNLRALPDSIGSIRTLQVLALRSNLLEKLPESWKDMENLTTLDLSCNRLTYLPPDLARLPKLTHLDLHDNQIQALPEKMSQLSSLVVLHVGNNHLRELPRDIGRLRDLQDLVLSFNFIQSLPDEIGKLNKLQELKFDNNPLYSLPKTIQRLVNVRRVHLQGCALRDLPVELGVAFKEMVYLDLSRNQFEVMPALDQMYKLEEFYISNNYLREIGTSSLNLSPSYGSGSAGSNNPGSNNNNNNNNSSSSSSGSNVGSGSTSGVGSGGIHNGFNSGLLSGSMVGGTMTQTMSGVSSSGTLPGGYGNGSNVGSGSGSGSGTGTGSGSGTGFGTVSLFTAGGVTASKLCDLKRLRVFEAHHNQIRVLSTKIQLLQQLEVLDLGDNLLEWLPKEVGDLGQLKVLLLKGNPLKSLPSSLTKLMGSLEVFRIGEWPENGFEITRDQVQMNMKINVLQSFMPQQIERTLLWRMHESILKRVQELDSQRYRDQHNLDGDYGSGPVSRALITNPAGSSVRSMASMATTVGQVRPFGMTHGLSSHSSSISSTGKQPYLGISQGLAIATQNMMVNRSFALPPVSSGENGSVSTSAEESSASSSMTTTTTTHPEWQSLNSEGIHPNYVEYPVNSIRMLPTLQLSSVSRHSSGLISSQQLTQSPSPASAMTTSAGTLSAFPLLNGLRPRKSHQQLSTTSKNNNSLGGVEGVTADKSARPRSMYAFSNLHQQEELMQQQQQQHQQQQHQQQQQSPLILQKLNNRMSRVFEFATGSSSGSNKISTTASAAATTTTMTTTSSETLSPGRYNSSTIESSMLQLSSDAMMALGLESHPGSAGSVIRHSNGGNGAHRGSNDYLGVVRFGTHRTGDGNLSDIKSSLAIKSSPSLVSSSTAATATTPGGGGGGGGGTTSTSISAPLGLFSLSRATSPTLTGSNGLLSKRPSLSRASKSVLGRPSSPLPNHVYSPTSSSGYGSGNEKSTTSLPWLRLRTMGGSGSGSGSGVNGVNADRPASSLDDYTAGSTGGVAPSLGQSLSTSSLLMRQPSLTGGLLNAPTPPPILLDYELDTTATLDIPQHLYYSAGGDDVDGDRPTGETGEMGDGPGGDEYDDDDDGVLRRDSKGSLDALVYDASQPHLLQQQYERQRQEQLNSTDPVLKIAVLKGIYDQILHNMDRMAEQDVQESPAKKNNRFKLLNSLRFLKSHNNGGSGGGSSNGQSHGLSNVLAGHNAMTSAL
ncbi:hypothetical protein BGZ94_001596, partial [Podila epigama]